MTDRSRDELWRRLYQGIGAVLSEKKLEPTPVNYALVYRYLTAKDAAFNGLVDRAMSQGGLTAASAAAIMAERNVELSAADLQRMIADASAQLAEVGSVVATSQAAAAEYTDALATNAAELAAGAPVQPTVDTLVSLTQSMIEQTRGVEGQLHAAADEIRQLRDNLAEAQDAANRDALTGLPNRRALDTRLVEATDEARQNGKPFSIAICDIDHFKAFNDRYGHQIGDEVIKFVASSLTREANDRLFAARYGGEEFVVLFENADATKAGREIDKIRASIGARELRVNATGEALGKLTFSAGIAQLMAEDEGTSSMLKRADVALYRAKNEGRNRVVVA